MLQHIDITYSMQWLFRKYKLWIGCCLLVLGLHGWLRRVRKNTPTFHNKWREQPDLLSRNAQEKMRLKNKRRPLGLRSKVANPKPNVEENKHSLVQKVETYQTIKRASILRSCVLDKEDHHFSKVPKRERHGGNMSEWKPFVRKVVASSIEGTLIRKMSTSESSEEYPREDSVNGDRPPSRNTEYNITKRDSWLWFNERTSNENFTSRKQKFQSRDPRVAEIAAEIEVQERRNKEIERDARSLIESSGDDLSAIEKSQDRDLPVDSPQSSELFKSRKSSNHQDAIKETDSVSVTHYKNDSDESLESQGDTKARYSKTAEAQRPDTSIEQLQMPMAGEKITAQSDSNSVRLKTLTTSGDKISEQTSKQVESKSLRVYHTYTDGMFANTKLNTDSNRFAKGQLRIGSEIPHKPEPLSRCETPSASGLSTWSKSCVTPRLTPGGKGANTPELSSAWGSSITCGLSTWSKCSITPKLPPSSNRVKTPGLTGGCKASATPGQPTARSKSSVTSGLPPRSKCSITSRVQLGQAPASSVQARVTSRNPVTCSSCISREPMSDIMKAPGSPPVTITRPLRQISTSSLGAIIQNKSTTPHRSSRET